MKRPLQVTVLGLIVAAVAACFLGNTHPPEPRYRSTYAISAFIEVQPEGLADPSKHLRNTVLVSTNCQLHGGSPAKSSTTATDATVRP